MKRLIVLILLTLAPPLSPTPETCNAIHALVGGELVEWLGYPQGWDLPDDLKKSSRIEFAEGGIWDYYSASQQAHYLIVFTSYEQTTNPNGEHFGAHEFCGLYNLTH